MIDTRQQELARHGDLISPFTGRVLSQAEVDAYNRYTLDFNRLPMRLTRNLCWISATNS